MFMCVASFMAVDQRLQLCRESREELRDTSINYEEVKVAISGK